MERQCPRLNRKFQSRTMTVVNHSQLDNGLPCIEHNAVASGSFSHDTNVNDIVNQLIEDLIFDVASTVLNKRAPATVETSGCKPRIFPCSTCKTMFAQFASAAKHCLKEKTKKTKCTVCDKIVDKKNFSRHMKKHINTKLPTSFVCEMCKITVSSKQKLDDHKLVKHNVQRPIYMIPESAQLKCPYCEFQHLREVSLKRHITIKHFIGEKYNCSQCPYTCNSRGGLYQHKKQAHNVSNINAVSVDVSLSEARSCGDIYGNETVLVGESSARETASGSPNETTLGSVSATVVGSANPTASSSANATTFGSANATVLVGEGSAIQVVPCVVKSANGAVPGKVNETLSEGQNSVIEAALGRASHSIMATSLGFESYVNEEVSSAGRIVGSNQNSQVRTLAHMQTQSVVQPSVSYPSLSQCTTESMCSSRMAGVPEATKSQVCFVNNQAYLQPSNIFCTSEMLNVPKTVSYLNNPVLLQPMNQSISAGCNNNLYFQFRS